MMNVKEFIQFILLCIFTFTQGCGPLYEPGPYGLVKPRYARIPYEQEPGIRGGDVVKAAGNYLIVLRQSYLFSIRLKDGTQNILRPISKFNTIHKGSKMGAWQKELFVSGQRIVVLGYSDALQALEVGLFDINRFGILKHISTNYISGCAFYYNLQTLIYKSRMVGEQLILYVAEHSYGYTNVRWNNGWPTCGNPLSHAPRAPTAFMMSYWNGQSITKWKSLHPKPISSYVQVNQEDYSTHAIYYCNISQQYLSCKARAVKGGFASSIYVSQKAIYLWTLLDKYNDVYGREALIYRFPISPDQNKAITMLRAYGVAANQHSLYETKDGHFYAVVAGAASYKRHDSIPRGLSRTVLLHAPISKFTETPSKKIQVTTQELPEHIFQDRIQNRFVSNFYVYGFTWNNKGLSGGAENLYVLNLDTKKMTIISLDHDVEEIKMLGESVIVHGTKIKTLTASNLSRKGSVEKLYLSSILLKNTPQLKDTFTYEITKYQPLKTKDPSGPQTVRSPLFYHRFETPKKGGILALPIQYSRSDFRNYPYGTAQILLLQVDENLLFSQIGTINALEQKVLIPYSKECNGFCSENFYENVRPIFYDSRIFALIGTHLVEVKQDKSMITEIRRINFYNHTYKP